MKDPGSPATAVVLRRFDYSESSQIARLYTREFGRVSVLAKGIRRPNPDLLGPMDLGALGEAAIRLKKGDALSLLTRWRTVTGWPGQRSSLEKLVASAHWCELWCEGVRDGDPDPPLFDALVGALRALEAAPEEAVPALTLAGDLAWLGAAGFGPELGGCVACGKTAPPNAAARLSPGRGGVVCSRCVDPGAPGLVPLSAGERRTLVALASEGPPAAPRFRLGRKDLATLRPAVDRLLEHALERELKSARYLGAW